MKIVLWCIAAALALAGCAAHEQVHFQAGAGQEAIVRDGQPALLSRRASSLVLARPASREFRSGKRVAYVVGIYNMTQGPLLFEVKNVRVTQVLPKQGAKLIKVYTYEELVGEENTRQTVAAVATGLAVAGNAMSAANAGNYRANATVVGPGGVKNVSVTGYDPTAAAIAQSQAAAQNEAMVTSVVAQGRANLDTLEHSIMKDNTLFPGEWYGGQIVFDPPEGDAEKNYQISFQVGPDLHRLAVTQDRMK